MSERNLDIEAKLTALLELSKSTAEGTENEAKLALETAIRLAAKYGISLAKLADKRKAYAGGDWFGGTPETTTVEYTEDRYRDVGVRSWCAYAEANGWQRHRRGSDEKEGQIWSYRQEGRTPKLEVRVFERPWGDVEFEVVQNPDPIIGKLEQFVRMGFDCIELGVTYDDFCNWVDGDKLAYERISNV